MRFAVNGHLTGPTIVDVPSIWARVMSATDDGETVQATEEQGGAVGDRPEADRLSAVIEALMEEQRQREVQVAEDHARREREFERLQERREHDMQEKMDVVLRLLETVKGKDHAGESAVRVAKLTDTDDIEGYLTTDGHVRHRQVALGLFVSAQTNRKGTGSVCGYRYGGGR